MLLVLVLPLWVVKQPLVACSLLVCTREFGASQGDHCAAVAQRFLFPGAQRWEIGVLRSYMQHLFVAVHRFSASF